MGTKRLYAAALYLTHIIVGLLRLRAKLYFVIPKLRGLRGPSKDLTEEPMHLLRLIRLFLCRLLPLVAAAVATTQLCATAFEYFGFAAALYIRLGV